MIKDFLGNELNPGDIVVKVSRNGSTVRLTKRIVQSVDNGKLVLVREESWASAGLHHKNVTACDPGYCIRVPAA